MKVSELIARLSELPPDAPVFIDGYEGGIDDVRGVQRVLAKLNVNTEWYYGNHEVFDPDDDGDAPHCEGFLIG